MVSRMCSNAVLAKGFHERHPERVVDQHVDLAEGWRDSPSARLLYTNIE
jgi:hypothetical protein